MCVLFSITKLKLFNMKSIFAFNNEKSDSKVFGFEILSENEMLKVRGGTDPEKPKSRPIDEFDYEQE